MTYEPPKPLPGIVFEEPPALRRVVDPEWQPVVDALVSRPSEWALIFEGGHRPGLNLAARLRIGSGVWGGRRWQVRTRTVAGESPEGLLKVWARCMPEASPDPSAAYKADQEDELNETGSTK